MGQQEPDDFLVTGGELVLSAVEGERVEGSFRVEVRSQELEETVPGAPPADTTNATRATVSGTFQATKRCLGDA